MCLLAIAPPKRFRLAGVLDVVLVNPHCASRPELDVQQFVCMEVEESTAESGAMERIHFVCNGFILSLEDSAPFLRAPSFDSDSAHLWLHRTVSRWMELRKLDRFGGPCDSVPLRDISPVSRRFLGAKPNNERVVSAFSLAVPANKPFSFCVHYLMQPAVRKSENVVTSKVLGFGPLSRTLNRDLFRTNEQGPSDAVEPVREAWRTGTLLMDTDDPSGALPFAYDIVMVPFRSTTTIEAVQDGQPTSPASRIEVVPPVLLPYSSPEPSQHFAFEQPRFQLDVCY